MTEKANVTVAIIAYYYPDFLRECIASVLAQTYKNMKVVVYDDCSPENLREVVDSFDDERLSYVRNVKNLGACDNTNQAIDLCETEYLCVFHGDDRMFPWMVESLVRVMEMYPNAGIVGPSKPHFLGSPIPSNRVKNSSGTLYRQNEYVLKMCKLGRFLSGQPLFRKPVIDAKKMRFIKETGIAGDIYFWLEANSKGVEIFLLDEALFEYRVDENNNSTTRKSNAEKWFFSFKKIDELIVGLNIKLSVEKLRTNYVVNIISYHVKSMAQDEYLTRGDIEELLSVREFIKEKSSWAISDRLFNDAVVIGFLQDSVMNLAHRKISLQAYLARERRLIECGIKVSLIRRLKWFIRYFVLQ